MDLQLGGKRALVCGGTRGIGFACAAALTSEGSNLVLVGRDNGRLMEAHDRLKRGNSSAAVRTLAADMQTQDGYERILSECQDVDILIMVPPRASELSWDEIDLSEATSTVTTLLALPVMLAKGAALAMLRRKFGRIVSILGTSVKAPLPSHLLSNAARTGYLAAMSSLSRSLAPSNVTINSILIGHVDTDGLHEVWSRRAQKTGTQYAEVAASAISRIPMRRLGEPDEAGALCAFLSSPRAGYVTGQSIVMDGGAYPGLF